ncbi:MAG TPA: hypothetical protein VJS89_10960 [Gammaproteobacteria bacterium]|nr:hypothetical protein [Gammaproteobacteria bacterium]
MSAYVHGRRAHHRPAADFGGNGSVGHGSGLAPFFITALIKLTGNAMAPAFYVIGGMLLALASYGVWGRDVNRRDDLKETPRPASV